MTSTMGQDQIVKVDRIGRIKTPRERVPNFFVIVADGAIVIVAFGGFDRTGVVI